jgi:hypothetical protein
MGEQDPDGRRYVAKTLRVTAVVTIVVALTLASYGQNWAILPVIAGAALAGLLLYGWERFVRTAFSPEAVKAARENGRDRRWAIAGFALVKYPLVALLIWFLVQIWDQRQLMAFVGGVILLHVVIALRAAGSAFRRDTNSKE